MEVVHMDYRKEYEKWLASAALSAEEHAELESIANDPKEIESRFYGPLEFGTAGLRGTMHVGLHNMNIHVIRWATQGFCSVIAAEGEDAKRRGVAMSMDCRNHSMEFARAAAEVCAANGIHVRIFESLRPTPELSFAVREYGCQAGINVTASHNPKEYNGYKVYWADGAQLPPQHADAIAKALEGIDVFTGVKTMAFDDAVKAGLIETMGDETDRKFMANVTAMINDRETVAKVADTFKMVYTPFHGCGYKLVPEALHALGIKHLLCEPKQMVIDGSFPTVVSPNPENPEGFYLAIDLAKQNNIDFILGTDPDSDRVGIMIRNKQGEFQPVTGNQTGVLLLDYLIGAMKRAGKLPAKPVALKTIVTTEMARKVAETNGVQCFDTFTGFKFMAEKKNALEAAGEGKVIFSYEESYGYMLGDYVRDKDAVTASMLLTEMAAWYAAKGMTLFDALEALYEKYGHYAEKTHNLVMPGLDGLADMAKLMKSLRENPPAEIGGVKVVVRKDYADGTVTDCATGAVTSMELKGSNVLRFELADGTTILARPSGTEPKIKIYILTRGADASACDANIEKYGQWVATLQK
jgi:phosphoglucomutase